MCHDGLAVRSVFVFTEVSQERREYERDEHVENEDDHHEVESVEKEGSCRRCGSHEARHGHVPVIHEEQVKQRDNGRRIGREVVVVVLVDGEDGSGHLGIQHVAWNSRCDCLVTRRVQKLFLV